MNQAGAMLGQTADNGLIDRMLIELGLDSDIERKLKRIEDIVHWSRDRWHPKIADYLTRRAPPKPSTDESGPDSETENNGV